MTPGVPESLTRSAAMSSHYHIVLFAKRAKHMGYFNQYPVAKFMAKLIINCFEAVNVAH